MSDVKGGRSGEGGNGGADKRYRVIGSSVWLKGWPGPIEVRELPTDVATKLAEADVLGAKAGTPARAGFCAADSGAHQFILSGLVERVSPIVIDVQNPMEDTRPEWLRNLEGG